MTTSFPAQATPLAGAAFPKIAGGARGLAAGLQVVATLRAADQMS